MEVSLFEIISEARNAINARLDMLEMIVKIKTTNSTSTNLDTRITEIEHKLNELFVKKVEVEDIPEIIIKELETSIGVKEEKEEKEEEEEEEEEEEGIELHEFSYKGMTLYRGADNKVYQMDEDGAIGDPLGVWDESKQKIKKL